MLLTDLLVVFGVSGLIVYLFHLVRLPAVVGLLVSGVLVGPSGLSLVSELEHINLLAEIGVVVLLFTVGLEFSLARVVAMSSVMLRVGLPQVVLSIGLTAAATYWYFGTINQAIFVGILVAMSSTAVVIKMLADRGELSTLHSRIDVGTLLLQDIMVILCVLALPLLALRGPTPGGSQWQAPMIGLLVVSGVLLAGQRLIPRILYQIVKTRNRELFLIAIFVVCIGTATLTHWAGLSLALGAFLAGLTLAESEYGHQTLAEVLPFRDTLSSLFFVSVGMLLDVGFLVANSGMVAAVVGALVLIKFASVAGPALLAGYSTRTAVLAGLALAQVGEFSFVLSRSGIELGLLNEFQYQTFLVAAVVTMGACPFLIAGGPAIAQLLNLVAEPKHRDLAPEHALENHVIVAGYGFNGKNLATSLREQEIPYLVMETNPVAVRQARQQGESIMFGDCTRPAVLSHAGIEKARAMVIGISDPIATRRTVQIARQLNAELRIIVRTRYRNETDELRFLGANEVVPEEFEASLEIYGRVLREYHVPTNVITQLVARIRTENYELFRDDQSCLDRASLSHNSLGTALDVESVQIPESAAAHGRTLRQMAIRSRTSASIVAIRRGAKVIPNPLADFQLHHGDIVMLLGDAAHVTSATAILCETLEHHAIGAPLALGYAPHETFMSPHVGTGI